MSDNFLIIDEDEQEMSRMTAILRNVFPSADVQGVADTDLAVSLCAERAFDCVFLEMRRLNADGLSLANKLRKVMPFSPIVLMAEANDEGFEARALRAGVSDYIPKSRLSAESIKRVVRRAIHHSMQVRVIREQSEELENFAYALAHDFKQPIRQIRTFSQLVKDELGGVGQESMRQHLDFLSDAARRLGDLVDVMSQYTLLHQQPEISDVDLDSVVEDLRFVLAPMLTERSAMLQVGPLPRVRGNPTLMTQALQNLIVNGLRYNESAAPVVTVSAEAFDNIVVISVRDNGIGIEEEYIDAIFRPLFRLHTAEEKPGTGLGLTLTRRAVNSQGGQIWCESVFGEGAAFHIRLPRVVEQAEAVRRAS